MLSSYFYSKMDAFEANTKKQALHSSMKYTEKD
jgi:hypothetical protein